MTTIRRIAPLIPPAVVGDQGLHVVRRLGWSLLALWDELPTALQERFLEQARLVSDPIEVVQLREEIDDFVETYGGSLY